MDLSVSDRPRYLLYSNEIIIEGESVSEGILSKVLSVENLELYLNGEMNFNEMFKRLGINREKIKKENLFISDVEDRLEYLKNREMPMLNNGQRIVMKALLKSDCINFSLHNGNSVDKYYLLTLLSVIEWSPYFFSEGGWGNDDTVLAIAIDHDFLSSDIEIILPIKEVEELIYKLDKANQLCDPNAKKWIVQSKQHYEKKDNEIEEKLKFFGVDKVKLVSNEC
ncbi:hypothetical protein BJR07_29105 [Bacillus cereus]|uniref:Uncharacterized protein n=3 Tax=Bacillus TaxID=1386 RepID=A0A1Q4L4J0_BACCE|nr:hypothetical protein IAU_05502 [Bacillus cereus IS075]EOO82409.1 hypothetical protein IGS_05766 [Bacillus cereus IS845/00]EOO92588.1 hypothetical protein IGQ_05795 [Bacillus cereus IS195]OKA26083.1 hypothetical protein BJR06_30420 [Bacillus cereus]OKA32061.1 hypothetical protein BJR07_29105 [Bacillus cereus]